MGMFYMVYSFHRDGQRPNLRNKKGNRESVQFANTFKDIFHIATPVTASRMVGTFSYAIEPIVVAQSLALAGVTAVASTALYGQLEGMAVPLVFFPSFITYALSVSLVPAVSEAAAQKNNRLIEHRLNQSIRLSLIIGLPCAVVIYLMADSLALVLYKQVEVGHFIRLMAPFAVFLYIQGPLASALQGLDRAAVSMRNSIIGALIKTTLIFVLASQPQFGIDGVAIAVNCGIVIVTALHFLSIIPIVPVTLDVRELGKLTIILVIIGFLTHFLLNQEQWLLITRILYASFTSIVSYIILLFLFSVLHRRDLLRIPFIRKWFSNVLAR